MKLRKILFSFPTVFRAAAIPTDDSPLLHFPRVVRDVRPRTILTVGRWSKQEIAWMAALGRTQRRCCLALRIKKTGFPTGWIRPRPVLLVVREDGSVPSASEATGGWHRSMLAADAICVIGSGPALAVSVETETTRWNGWVAELLKSDPIAWKPELYGSLPPNPQLVVVRKTGFSKLVAQGRDAPSDVYHPTGTQARPEDPRIVDKGNARAEPQRKPSSPYEHLKTAKRYRETTIQLLGQDFKIADSQSFYYSYREIFQDRIYEFPSRRERPVILDCGSNYGTSIVFFKSLYPHSKITGVEADPRIFQLLDWNIKRRAYEGVSLINKCISSSDQPVRFFSEGADGGRVFPNETSIHSTDVSPVSLDDLITENIDFLKMDIEGSETEAICSSEKLRQVDHLFIEYHSFRNSPQTLSALLEKLSSSGFRYFIHTQFCAHRPLTEDRSQLGMDLQLNIFAKRTL